MAWVTLRCPRCGAYVAAPATRPHETSWASCPHCGTPLPVVAPRDPPPLFAWEVYPTLYPTLPPARAPGRRLYHVGAAALAVTVVLLVGIGGALVWAGAEALTPSTFSLAGTVVGSSLTLGPTGTPVAGASINATGENGYSATVVTGPTGQFLLTGVPAGGLVLNVTAPGFARSVVQVFLSKTYSATGGAGALRIVLPAAGQASTTVLDSPFADLESYLTSLWSAAILLGIAALVAAVGAWAMAAGRRPAFGVAGGAAAMVAPAALYLLSDATAFPLLAAPTAALSALGALALSLSAYPMAWTGRPTEPTN
jgi:hypothetical protein